jgi:hypothetical protein
MFNYNGAAPSHHVTEQPIHIPPGTPALRLATFLPSTGAVKTSLNLTTVAENGV